MVNFIVEGFAEAGNFPKFDMSVEGKLDRSVEGLGRIGPDDKYSKLQFSLEHSIQQKAIPGKEKKYITMRTSDVHNMPPGQKYGPLFKLTITQPTVGYIFWKRIFDMVDYGGPYHVTWAYATQDMYLTKGEFSQEEGFPEYPDTISPDSDIKAMVGTWILEFCEYYKGV